jgi:hypothetical protein
MRSVIAVVGAVSLVVAQVSPGFAQSTLPVPAQPAALAPPAETAVNPTIVEAFKAYPKGGDQLSKRLSDLIVKDPKLAVGLVKYVRTSSELVKDQKLAAERGLAAALTRMGVKAADMPLPPPAEEVWNPWYLLGLLALIPILCFAEFCKTSNNPPPVVSHH